MARWRTLALLMVVCGHAAAITCTPSEDGAPCLSQDVEKAIPVPPVSPTWAGGEVECETGTRWESRCHRCECLSDGRASCRKEEPCADEGEPWRCLPGSHFTRDCNQCTCTSDGLAGCTRRLCAPPPSDQRSEKPFSELPRGKDCAAGTSWLNQCNRCHCTSGGLAYCTLKGCPDSTEPARHCLPDSRWRADCNTCWCNGDGVAICTKIGCVAKQETIGHPDVVPENKEVKPVVESNASLIRKIRETTERAKACVPGLQFRMDCNECLCDTEGSSFSCTRNDCAANNGNARTKRELAATTESVALTCVAGAVFQRDCNVCKCGADGARANCTVRRCEPAQQPEPESDPNFRCNPGEQLRRGCSDCSCAADGRSVFCTVQLCGADLPSPPPATQ